MVARWWKERPSRNEVVGVELPELQRGRGGVVGIGRRAEVRPPEQLARPLRERGRDLGTDTDGDGLLGREPPLQERQVEALADAVGR